MSLSGFRIRTVLACQGRYDKVNIINVVDRRNAAASAHIHCLDLTSNLFFFFFLFGVTNIVDLFQYFQSSNFTPTWGHLHTSNSWPGTCCPPPLPPPCPPSHAAAIKKPPEDSISSHTDSIESLCLLSGTTPHLLHPPHLAYSTCDAQEGFKKSPLFPSYIVRTKSVKVTLGDSSWSNCTYTLVYVSLIQRNWAVVSQACH